jgi:molybdopterin-containing oxidoreductase family membrane subunit
MATTARPGRATEVARRPNVASANQQLPGVVDYEQVDRDIGGSLTPTAGWFGALAIAIVFFLWGAGTWTYQIYWGLGNAGYNPPVMWGVYIISFVFWVGIGHAGTLISAILYLFRAGFRTTIYRCAEAMTVFAVMTAGLFPIIHIGRPWKFFWLIPYPNWRLIWPNFKSPLVWDVFAISTYLTVSATFLYVGLVPDIAVLRDRATNPVRKRITAVMSLGWRNSEPGGATSRGCISSSPRSRRRWCCPCTRSCRSTSQWRSTPAGTRRSSRRTSSPASIFSGIGMVFTIIIPIRKFFNLQHYVTINHLDAAAKLCLFTSMVVGCAYLVEFWVAWYSANTFEQAYFWNRVFGQWWWAAWIMLTCNMIFPLSLFSRSSAGTHLAVHSQHLHQPRHVVRAVHRGSVAQS